jgi:hypothetical protein
VYAETCPQYLHLTWEDLASSPTALVMTPAPAMTPRNASTPRSVMDPPERAVVARVDRKRPVAQPTAVSEARHAPLTAVGCATGRLRSTRATTARSGGSITPTRLTRRYNDVRGKAVGAVGHVFKMARLAVDNLLHMLIVDRTRHVGHARSVL